MAARSPDVADLAVEIGDNMAPVVAEHIQHPLAFLRHRHSALSTVGRNIPVVHGAVDATSDGQIALASSALLSTSQINQIHLPIDEISPYEVTPVPMVSGDRRPGRTSGVNYSAWRRPVSAKYCAFSLSYLSLSFLAFSMYFYSKSKIFMPLPSI